MKSHITVLCALLAGLMLAGCGTLTYDGGSVAHLDKNKTTILLPPFDNATNDEFAGVALTEITASALMAKDVQLYQTEDVRNRLGLPENAGDGSYSMLAKEVGAQYVLLGTVHEYRYKTDLDGDPAVGVTMRLVDVQDGRTVWQGTASDVGFINASVTSAAQVAAKDLVNRMPLNSHLK
ncbi:hypothetical protein [Cerasicoccus fimbriatus]|uniref:hypothetical protein n=1 Tax=Cerasicoccus fimbriatus TaxID=3014554 RepID=UPI0022B2CE85|nr:hypothetical protein [Cerasicoccus sp. TK19100]